MYQQTNYYTTKILQNFWLISILLNEINSIHTFGFFFNFLSFDYKNGDIIPL